MAKYSVPGIKFTEIDNSVRDVATTSLGAGAFVMKANRGYVNQRISASNYDEFTQIFGTPEELDDYGHFAAENYFNNSQQLYVVRATMGDEQYAQIQYPYTDAETDFKYTSKDTASFRYVDNEDTSNLQLVDSFSAAEIAPSAYTDGGEWVSSVTGEKDVIYAVRQNAQFVTVNDLITDAATSVAVFKTVTPDGDLVNPSDITNVVKASGKYVEFVQNVSRDGEVTKRFDDLILTKAAWDGGSLSTAAFIIPSTGVTSPDGNDHGYKVQFTIPATATLNNASVACTMWVNDYGKGQLQTGSAVDYANIFTDSMFYKGSYSGEEYVTVEDAYKLQFMDWDDCRTKQYYVKREDIEGTVGQAKGIAYREYGMADKAEALIIGDDNTAYSYQCKKIPDILNNLLIDNEALAEAMDAKSQSEVKDFVTQIAEEYGLELTDINKDTYSILTYVDVSYGKVNDNDVEDANEKRSWKIIYTDDWDEDVDVNPYLFWVYSKKDSKQATTVSVYTATAPNAVVIPWQSGMVNESAIDADNKTAITKMIAYPTSEILNAVDGRYRNGYTQTCESDEEPGNGDIEQYVSNKDDQLIIAAIGPGTFGNDIGVSIITTECADIPALNHQNAFNWKYKYDDEDLVNADDPDTDFTWKKVYRINVYAKLKTQTADAAWGTGMDALIKDPIETWYVSNDPTAKDGEGKSLYAPNVINGHSDYIYVSRASVNNAMTGSGTYAQPVQTYAIYGLTGGVNSKKNNVAEKVQALKLFADRQKCQFDIIFNIEAIDTFSGKQRYAALQRRIAEIAASRTQDIGVVQVTSKEAKTVKMMLSEGKGFQFDNPSYVTACAGYDKYYNSDLGAYIYLPKSIAKACAIARCYTIANPWQAAAGTTYGYISYTSGQLTELSDDEIGQLADANINTSRMVGSNGECLWGQKTALKKNSALARENVRTNLNEMERNIEHMMAPYLFANNTANTRSAAKNILDSYLSRVKAADGIIEYATSVIQDPDDEHVMLVNIVVQPAEAIEFIDVKITVQRQMLQTTETVLNS